MDSLAPSPGWSLPLVTTYHNPALEAHPHPHSGGMGAFAREPIPAGTLLAVWSGVVVTAAQLAEVAPAQARYAVQVEEGIYLLGHQPPSVADFINHSCAPNAGLRGQITLVALRDIAAGEEVCYDYAMSDGTAYDEFDCACRAPTCRGRVTGDDWRRPELWVAYDGFFAPYLQRRIEALRKQQAACFPVTSSSTATAATPSSPNGFP